MAAYTKLRIGEFVSFEGEIEEVEASDTFKSETDNKQPQTAPTIKEQKQEPGAPIIVDNEDPF